MRKSIIVIASSCLLTASAMYNMHLSFDNEAFEKIKSDWLSTYYENNLYNKNVTIDRELNHGKFKFSNPVIKFAETSPKNFEDEVEIQPIAGSEVRQFSIAKSMNVSINSEITYKYGFISAKAHLDMQLVNT